MADGPGILDVNVPNFITISLMVLLLGAASGLVVKLFTSIRSGSGGSGKQQGSGNATTTQLSASGIQDGGY